MRRAIEAGVPIVTSVSPAFAAAWEEFAASLYVVLPADAGRIEAWRHSTMLAQPAHDRGSYQKRLQ